MEEKDEDNVIGRQINEIKASLGWEQIGKEKPTITINDIAQRIEEEAAAEEPSD